MQHPPNLFNLYVPKVHIGTDISVISNYPIHSSYSGCLRNNYKMYGLKARKIFILHMNLSFRAGFRRDHSGKESVYRWRRHRRHRFNPWIGKISWSRKWQLTPLFLPEKLHGYKRLVVYSPWGLKRVRYNWETEHATQLSRDSLSLVHLASGRVRGTWGWGLESLEGLPTHTSGCWYSLSGWNLSWRC